MGSCSTIVDWCSFAREVCPTILEVESQPIGGVGYLEELKERVGVLWYQWKIGQQRL